MIVFMKDKGPILILLLIAAGLGIALLVVSKQAADQKKEATESLVVASNNFTSVKKQLTELETVNQALETNLAAAQIDFSNKLASADANLRTAEANLEKEVAEAKAQADSNVVTLSQRDQKIADLESQNQALDKEADSLHMAITNLQTKIAVTEEKLAKSEGNRDLLLKELKVMRSEKEDLEKRFNSIEAVREQLNKLRTEAAIARRLDWIRRGISDTSDEKGGERLIHSSPAILPLDSNGANVELKQSGGVKIQTSPSTNAP
jgi:chromosome segregation ATPase